MKQSTLIIPRQRGQIALALKSMIHSDGRVLAGSEKKWNGWGGKREWYDLSISITAIREYWQESGAWCFPWDLKLVSRIYFYWPGDLPGHPTMHVYIYFLDSWFGTMKEKEKGKMGPPVFFNPENVPYENMMKGDRVFLPRLLAGEQFVANLYFDRKDTNGLPVLEEIGNAVSGVPWHVSAYLLALIWVRKAAQKVLR